MKPRRADSDLAAVLDSIASPIRLKIVTSLAQRKMSYSELAKAIGMDRDRDAGKFSYHLKKLLSNGLIEVDKSTGKYALSRRGMLVLRHVEKLEEEIGERTLMIVRRSDQLIEPFDKNKIAEALVKEAKLSPKLAKEIASIAEKKLFDLRIDYLTAPLIRELVNSILLDMGLEKYRHRLTRLGMPLYDVFKLFKKSFDLRDWRIFIEESSRAIAKEYLLLNFLPREAAELHLSGRIDIYPISGWLMGFFSRRFDLDSEDPSKLAAKIIQDSILIKRELRICGPETRLRKLLEIIGGNIPRKKIISLNFSDKILQNVTNFPPNTRNSFGFLINASALDPRELARISRALNKLHTQYVYCLSDKVCFSGFLLDREHAGIHSIITLNLLGVALESGGDFDKTVSKVLDYVKLVTSISKKGLKSSDILHGGSSSYSLIAVSGLIEASKYLAGAKTTVLEEAIEVASNIVNQINKAVAKEGGDRILLGGRCPRSAARRFKRIDAYRHGDEVINNLIGKKSNSYSITPLPQLEGFKDFEQWIDATKKLAEPFNGGCVFFIKPQKSTRVLREVLTMISELKKVNENVVIAVE